jgi:hypothetical protein
LGLKPLVKFPIDKPVAGPGRLWIKPAGRRA